ncbi:class I SAM-dependent methyltransferase [Prochlorococcus sp. MIT 1011]|uniref:class I SAM-dependent methyltransferase n=1 Tax=Prochlorococcus sp. MIT 1011 TaxID=3082520 RepID=UPI0039B53F4E
MKYILVKISRFVLLIYRIINLIIPIELKGYRSGYKAKSKLKLKLQSHVVDETFTYFKNDFEKSVLFEDVYSIREYALKNALFNDKNKEYYYLEFGVWKGESANFWSKFVNKLYCFDSFEGLREDWGGRNAPIGKFTNNKKIPKLNSNIEPIVGWVEDTLDDFLNRHSPKINFVHLDMDTYSPTKFTLEKLKPYLVKNSIIIFDELYNYYGWKHHEYKALKEVFNEDEFVFKAFNLRAAQCVIQIK